MYNTVTVTERGTKRGIGMMKVVGSCTEHGDTERIAPGARPKNRVLSYIIVLRSRRSDNFSPLARGLNKRG